MSVSSSCFCRLMTLCYPITAPYVPTSSSSSLSEQDCLFQGFPQRIHTVLVSLSLTHWGALYRILRTLVLFHEGFTLLRRSFRGPVACHCDRPIFCVSSSFSSCYDLSTFLACAQCPPTRDLFFLRCWYKTSLLMTACCWCLLMYLGSSFLCLCASH